MAKKSSRRHLQKKTFLEGKACNDAADTITYLPNKATVYFDFLYVVSFSMCDESIAKCFFLQIECDFTPFFSCILS